MGHNSSQLHYHPTSPPSLDIAHFQRKAALSLHGRVTTEVAQHERIQPA